jgi:dolichol-phosphate mannosyltransferase
VRIPDIIERLSDRFGIDSKKAVEFFKFSVVGATGVGVNMGLLYVLTRFFGLPVEWASPIAIEVSILSNFMLNNYWTFVRRDTHVKFGARLVRYHLVTGLAGLVNYGTLLLLVKVFHLNDMLANLIGILLGTIINYLLNSLWTWQKSTEST